MQTQKQLSSMDNVTTVSTSSPKLSSANSQRTSTSSSVTPTAAQCLNGPNQDLSVTGRVDDPLSQHALDRHHHHHHQLNAVQYPYPQLYNCSTPVHSPARMHTPYYSSAPMPYPLHPTGMPAYPTFHPRAQSHYPYNQANVQQLQRQNSYPGMTCTMAKQVKRQSELQERLETEDCVFQLLRLSQQNHLSNAPPTPQQRSKLQSQTVKDSVMIKSQLKRSSLESDNDDDQHQQEQEVENKIPRPPNAFMLYRKDHHHLIKKEMQENPQDHSGKQFTVPEISKVLGARWKSESEEVKMKYHEMARLADEEHRKLYPGYKYSPKKRRKLAGSYNNQAADKLINQNNKLNA
ncbi:hypothetical protein MIR68_010350 [Amoeboaphelidium protococcarum]|nr:hypothetical protein MIR68_010350 [Amoeboaphelidium protococcarum]